MAMMNYRRDNTRSLGKRLLLPLFLVFIVLFLYVFGIGLLHFVLRAVLSVTAPVWNATSSLAESHSNCFALFARKESLVEENTALRRQATELTLVRAENERLREELAEFTRVELPSKSLVASVLARPPQSIYDTLIIDVSQLSSVRQGMLVLSLDGAALGTVTEVNGSTAKVLLFSSSGVQTSGVINASSTAIDLAGRGGGTFRATLPTHSAPSVGTRITSPRLGNRIVAFVEALTPDTSQLSTTIDARVPVSLSTLRFVILLHAPALSQ